MSTCEVIKKLVPALAEFKDAYIVTADDDIYYPRDWLSMLVSAVNLERREGCRRPARAMDRIRGRWLLCSIHMLEVAWERRTPASARVLLTGVGGTLYPPNCFAAEIWLRTSRNFLACPRAPTISGSISFFARTVMFCRKVGGWIPSEIVEGSQQQSLWAINEGGASSRAWNRLVRGVRMSNTLRKRRKGTERRSSPKVSLSPRRDPGRGMAGHSSACGSAGPGSVEERGE